MDCLLLYIQIDQAEGDTASKQQEAGLEPRPDLLQEPRLFYKHLGGFPNDITPMSHSGFC